MKKFLFLTLPALLVFLFAPASANAAEPVPASAAVTYRVTLKDFADQKIAVIKILRDATPGLGLAEAKKLVESAPAVIAETSASNAAKLRQALEAVGAKVEMVPPLPEGVRPPQATHRVILQDFADRKIPAIKLVRDATGLGLADAKKLVESAPVTVKETDEIEAARLVKDFENIGAKATAEPVKK